MTQKSTYQLLEEIERREGVHDFLFAIHYSFHSETDAASIEFMETKLRLEGYSNSLITKVKMLSIEILQNILKHQLPKSDFLPYFALGKTENELLILAGNEVTMEDKLFLEEKFNSYLSIETDKLKEVYKKELLNNDFSSQGNLGIGLLDIVYRSNKKIDYYFDSLSNTNFSFNICVTIPC